MYICTMGAAIVVCNYNNNNSSRTLKRVFTDLNMGFRILLRHRIIRKQERYLYVHICVYCEFILIANVPIHRISQRQNPSDVYGLTNRLLLS
jgi:hypothetical protein